MNNDIIRTLITELREADDSELGKWAQQATISLLRKQSGVDFGTAPEAWLSWYDSQVLMECSSEKRTAFVEKDILPLKSERLIKYLESSGRLSSQIRYISNNSEQCVSLVDAYLQKICFGEYPQCNPQFIRDLSNLATNSEEAAALAGWLIDI